MHTSLTQINELYNLDAFEFLSKLQNDSVDLIYLDPPFATGRIFKTKSDEIAFNDKITLSELIKLLSPIIQQIARVLNNRGTFYLHGNSNFIEYIKIECDKIFGIENHRNSIIWYHNSGRRKEKEFGKRHDTILRYSKSDDYFFEPIREDYSPTAPRGFKKEKYYHPDGKVIDDVWKIPIIAQNDKRLRKEFFWPTMKPPELFRRIILSSCPDDGVFVDPMIGSGISCAVAKYFNKNFIGNDMSKFSIETAQNLIKKTDILSEYFQK